MRDSTTSQGGSGTVANPGNHGRSRSRQSEGARRRSASGGEGIPAQRDGAGAGSGTGGGAGAGGGHRRGGTQPPRSRRARTVRWISLSVALLILISAGAAYGYYSYLADQIRKGERSSGTSNVAKPKANANDQTPMNILVLGSDSRNDPADLKLGGARATVGEAPRADVIMLMHLSADRTNMSVVSIPRDTRVPIPECADRDTGKKWNPSVHSIINESLGRGGPGCTLAAVQNLTGAYIDHWLTIDFSGVVKMADVIGGVEVCVKYNVWDHPTRYQSGGSGLKLKAGKQKIYGKTALQWLRTRHAFFDDAGRSRAQHMYMSSMMRELRQQNLFGDPGRLNSIATAAISAFKVSEEIGTPKKLYDLGMELKSVPPNRMTMLTMPHIPDTENKEHYLPGPDAGRIWSLLRNDVAMDANGKAKATATPGPSTSQGPAAAPASSIPVTVVNGTAGDSTGVPVSHRAGAIAATLVNAGFTKASASQQAQPSKGTTLTYPTGDGAQGKADALAVAQALKIPVSAVKPAADTRSITLVIGADWSSGTDFSKTLPVSGSVPDTARAINGAEEKCMDVYKPYRW